MGIFNSNSNKKIELTVSNSTVIRVVAVILAALIFLNIMRAASWALTLLFVAFFLSIALNAPVRWIAGRLPGRAKHNRTAAIGLSFLVVILIIAIFISLFIPTLFRQTTAFIDTAPDLITTVQNNDSSLGGFVDRYNLDQYIDEFSDELSERLDDIAPTALSAVSRAGQNLIATVTVLVLTFMMLIEGPKWMEEFRKIVPSKKRKRVDKVVSDMNRVIKGYVNGQLLLASMAALFILPPLFILNISYPIALSVVVFICGLIPMVGGIIGGTIVTLVALFTSPISAIIILGYFVLYQQIENYIIQPKVQANSTNMSPLLVFTSVVIGANIAGLLGGLLAIPIAGCLRVLVLDYIEQNDMLSTSEIEPTKT